MLDNIKQCIQELPDQDFAEFFNRYVLNVQDTNISLEIESTLKKLKNDICDIDRIIEHECEGLVKHT